MFRKIYSELVVIRKELQAIRKALEFKGEINAAVKKSIDALNGVNLQVQTDFQDHLL